VSAPKGLSVELLLPDTNRSLDFPKSGSWCDVELPELREGLDPTDLKTLVGSFKDKASKIASEGRVVMYKDRGPGDIAEEMAVAPDRGRPADYIPPLARVDPRKFGMAVVTKQNKTDEQLAGLVYSLTPKIKADVNEPWIIRPAVAGTLLVVLCVIINLIFW
jgi:hypothetical protein